MKNKKVRKEKEIWEDVKGYKGIYQVSTFGNIKNIKTNIIKKLNAKSKNDYVVVCLIKDKKPKCYNVHRLVAEAFIPNPNKYKVVNHKDGNKANNNVDNLEWVVSRQNTFHCIYEDEKTSNQDMVFIKKFTNISIASICRKLNINRYNLLSKRTSDDNIKKVKDELEKQIRDIIDDNCKIENK